MPASAARRLIANQGYEGSARATGARAGCRHVLLLRTACAWASIACGLTRRVGTEPRLLRSPCRPVKSWRDRVLFPGRVEVGQDVPAFVGEKRERQDGQGEDGAVQRGVLVVLQFAVPVRAVPVEPPAQEREDGHPPRWPGVPGFQPFFDDQPLGVECGALDDGAGAEERAHE